MGTVSVSSTGNFNVLWCQLLLNSEALAKAHKFYTHEAKTHFYSNIWYLMASNTMWNSRIVNTVWYKLVNSGTNPKKKYKPTFRMHKDFSQNKLMLWIWWKRLTFVLSNLFPQWRILLFLVLVDMYLSDGSSKTYFNVTKSVLWSHVYCLIFLLLWLKPWQVLLKGEMVYSGSWLKGTHPQAYLSWQGSHDARSLKMQMITLHPKTRSVSWENLVLNFSFSFNPRS